MGNFLIAEFLFPLPYGYGIQRRAKSMPHHATSSVARFSSWGRNDSALDGLAG